MSYTVDYSGLTGKAKRAKALEDTRFYLGDRYTHVRQTVGTWFDAKPTKTEIKQAINGLSFIGIRGYPAKVLVMDILRCQRI